MTGIPSLVNVKMRKLSIENLFKPYFSEKAGNSISDHLLRKIFRRDGIMSQNPPHLPRHSPSTLSYQMIYAYLAERSRYASKKKGQTFYCDFGVENFARGRTQQMFIRGDSARGPTPPLTLLYTIFHEKGTPFVYPVLANGTPFT